MLVSLISTLSSCRSVETVDLDEGVYRETVVGYLPDPPEAPVLPELHWTYQAGLYCLSEEDVDLFIEFKVQTLPDFTNDYGVWLQQLEVVLQTITN